MTRVFDTAFAKGHGTGNDFIVLRDLDDREELTPERVRWLCDRRMGIGADGVLRVVRTEHVPQLSDFAAVAEYFMDYRNADGSTAEMCGNGVRVFARYLCASGLIEADEFVVATRSGLVPIELRGDGITVDMGHVRDSPVSGNVLVQLGGRSWSATPVHVPNPHAVVLLPEGEDLEQFGPALSEPQLPAEFVSGANVEFVQRVGPGHVRMRVFERGVGETWSCGTGACAAAWVSAQVDANVSTWQVDVPGGAVRVDIAADGRLFLTGPALLVARGTFQWPPR